MSCYYCNYLCPCPYKYQRPCFNQFYYPVHMNGVYPYSVRSPIDLARFSDIPYPCSPTRPPEMSLSEIKRKV